MTDHTRVLRLDDAPVLTALVQANRAFLEPWEPVRGEAYFTEPEQRSLIEAALAAHAAGTTHPRVILDEDGRVVGRINLNNIVRGPFQSASVGYWLDQSSGGRGLTTLAVEEIVQVAFAEEGLHRVEAGTIPENLRSQAVLQRAGFVRFGYAPRYLQIAGRYRDHILFQRLADEDADQG